MNQHIIEFSGSADLPQLFFRIPLIEDPGRVDAVISELYRLTEEPSAKTGETARTAFLRKYFASLTSSYYFLC